MPSTDQLEAIKASLAEKPDGVLEALAESHGVPLRTVMDCLPAGQAVPVPGNRFEAVWSDLVQWGTVTFIVHTRDGVFETRGTIPPGSFGRGFFNIHGDSPIGGHLRADRCVAIYFVDRPFFGRRSCSLVFVNGDGEAMFKVFVGRDAERELDRSQVGRFEALRAGSA
jgi:heme iron utilization protein